LPVLDSAYFRDAVCFSASRLKYSSIAFR